MYFDRAEITPDTSPTAAAAAAHATERDASFASGSGTGASFPPSGAASGALLVAVSAPEKRSDAGSALGRLTGKKYVTFAVAFRADGLQPYEHVRVTAGAPRRRFRDFVGLAARLVRGCVVVEL